MANVRIELTGRTGLVCHNVALADPDYPFTRQIKEITGKKTKTEEDRRAVERLEWYGGLYTSPDVPGPVLPTANVRQCLIESARSLRLGKDVERAVAFADLYVPISYEGPRNIDDLWEKESFRYRTMTGVRQNKVPRMRPIFPRWVIQTEAYLVEDIMDFENLVRVVDLAGTVEGLGDNRVNGYGRFVGKVARA